MQYQDFTQEAIDERGAIADQMLHLFGNFYVMLLKELRMDSNNEVVQVEHCKERSLHTYNFNKSSMILFHKIASDISSQYFDA